METRDESWLPVACDALNGANPVKMLGVIVTDVVVDGVAARAESPSLAHSQLFDEAGELGAGSKYDAAREMYKSRGTSKSGRIHTAARGCRNPFTPPFSPCTSSDILVIINALVFAPCSGDKDKVDDVIILDTEESVASIVSGLGSRLIMHFSRSSAARCLDKHSVSIPTRRRSAAHL